MSDEKDAKLATALRAAKQQVMYFAFVAVGSTDGVLMVSKKKVPVKDINAAKAESGGKKVFRGRCQMVDGRMTFEIAKEPPSTMAKQLKAVIHASAGMMMQVEARQAPDLEEEGEEGENEAEGNEAAPPIPPAPPAPPPPPGAGVSGQVPPAPPPQQQGGTPPPPAPSQDPAAARFTTRFKAIAPIMQKLEAIKNAAAKDAKLALAEASTFFRKNQFGDANDTLDIVEGLIKEALAGAAPGGKVPPAPPPPSQQDPGAARFAARLKALAPIVPKAEATGSDFARQAKFQIAEGNKLYIAKQYNDANRALDQAESLIKQAFTSATVSPGTGGLSVAKLGKARIEWPGIQSKAIADIKRLQVALQAVFQEDTNQVKQLAAAIKRLDSVLTEFDADIGAQLDDVLNAKDENQRRGAVQTAKATMARFSKWLETDDVMANIDGNEILPDLQVTAPMQTLLRDIAVSLG